MTKSQPLAYMPAMFATCMLFQVIFVLCTALWILFPDLKGHALLAEIFPGFRLLDVTSFVYGLVASGLYGWFVAAVFVFFNNLWPRVARLGGGSKANQARRVRLGG
ncbi:MAG TPA: hypothetical protein VJS85_02640 [Rhizomicrobium sp.]|nr:hypothetical protein [Rhizomicrobium sp.]